jgi:AraC family transcriptional regulator
MMNQILTNPLPRLSLDAPKWRHTETPPAPATAHYEAVKRVIEAMHERLDAPFTLNDMSKIAYVSPYHFNRMFHQVTGIPPCQFLYALRLETAKRLLLTTHVSVTDVCLDVGYNSLGTFIRRFTGLVGISPSRFRSLAHTATAGVFGQQAGQLLDLSAAPFDGEAAATALPGGIAGQATAPAGFKGAIFIGLFTTPIPQGSPISGTVITQPGAYHIAHVPDGKYYILAAGLAWSEDPKEYFLYESALRGGGQAIRIQNGQVTGSTDLTLRPPTPFDPPILMTLPLLLAGSMRGM